MEHWLKGLFSTMGLWAIPISILISVIIHVVGFLPSVFITTVNIWYWGPWFGGIISWLGEVLGSATAFILYRKGIQKANIKRHQNWKWLQHVNELSTTKQFLTLILARITPFLPSGLINLLGAFTSLSFTIFLLSTAIGKFPSMALEVWISYGFLHIEENYLGLTITLLTIGIGYFLFKKQKTNA